MLDARLLDVKLGWPQSSEETLNSF